MSSKNISNNFRTAFLEISWKMSKSYKGFQQKKKCSARSWSHITIYQTKINLIIQKQSKTVPPLNRNPLNEKRGSQTTFFIFLRAFLYFSSTHIRNEVENKLISILGIVTAFKILESRYVTYSVRTHTCGVPCVFTLSRYCVGLFENNIRGFGLF